MNRYLGQTAAFAALYFLAAWVGLPFAEGKSHAPPACITAGLALAGLLFLGWKAWPGILLGAFLANFGRYYESAPMATSFWVSAIIATGHSVDALAGWWLTHRFLGQFARTRKLEHLFTDLNPFRWALLAFAMSVSGVSMCAMGVCGSGLEPWTKFAHVWSTWWVAKACSIQIVTPFLLAWTHPLKLGWEPKRVWEGVTVFGVLSASIWVVFANERPSPILSYLTMAALIWIAVRLSPRAVISALMYVAVASVAFTIFRRGPFASSAFSYSTPQDSILLLLVFLWFVALACMMLSGMVNALRRNEMRFAVFMNHMPGAAFIKDLEGRYVFANEHLTNSDGWKAMDWVGKSDRELMPEEAAKVCEADDHKVLQGGSALQTVESLPSKGALREMIVQRFLLPDSEGAPELLAGIGIDITELKQAEERSRAALEKELLLRREINHRVKNNLQVISSLLFLQSTSVEDTNLRQILTESQARVRSISLIYDRLVQRHDVTGIVSTEYITALPQDLFTAYRVNKEQILLEISADELFLDLDTAVPCGLIITELVSNTLKHAFPNGRKGTVRVGLHSPSDALLCLSVCDNGVGLPQGFDLNRSTSVGMSIVRDLGKQLGADIEIINEAGTFVSVTFCQKLSASGRPQPEASAPTERVPAHA